MIHLIGVDHLVQYNGPVPESIRIEFRSYLIRICRELDIRVIAEEFSNEALREVYQATAETAQEAALILGLEHRYCDPGEKELAELGIPYYGEILERVKIKYNVPPSYIIDYELRNRVTAYAVDIAKSYWHIREQYWYSQLSDIMHSNILFICGHEHIDRFQSLLIERGHQSMIINDFWKKELFKDYVNLNLA